MWIRQRVGVRGIVVGRLIGKGYYWVMANLIVMLSLARLVKTTFNLPL